MKTSCQIFLGLALIFLLSCGGKTVVISTPPEPIEPPEIYEIDLEAELLFTEAEELFKEKSYSQALNSYRRYINEFPEGSKAPEVLWRIGSIYTAMGKSAEALSTFEQLITTYPDSPPASKAMIQRLIILYQAARYQEIIDASEVVLAHHITSNQRIRLNVLLGDTYAAIGSLSDAIYYYAQAMQPAREETRAKIVPKLKEALRQLSSDEMVVLLPRLQGNIAGGYLLFQLGKNQVNDGRYEEAIEIISTLIQSYPNHENYDEARSLLAEIRNKPTYERYMVGCLLPLSGRYKLYGQKALNGIQMALEQFGYQRPDLNIRIVIKDTGSNLEQTVKAVRELIDQRAAAIIGPIAAAESAATEAQAAGVPIITMTQKQDIPLIGDWVFRNFITPRMQVKSLASFALNTLQVKQFAIFYPNEQYGNTFMNLFWDELNIQGGQVTAVESYQTDQTDFTGAIKKLMQGRHQMLEQRQPAPDENFTPIIDGWENGVEAPVAVHPSGFEAIFIPDAPKKVGLILPQLAYHDIQNVYLMGTNLWHSQDLIRMASHYAQGAICVAGFFAQSDSLKVYEFTRRYEETFAKTPDFMAAISYDTAMMLFDIISRPNLVYRSAIKYGLMNVNAYQGVTGATSFDDTGEVSKQLSILQLKHDRFVEINADPHAQQP